MKETQPLDTMSTGSLRQELLAGLEFLFPDKKWRRAASGAELAAFAVENLGPSDVSELAQRTLAAGHTLQRKLRQRRG
jgi:hypothetical protein